MSTVTLSAAARLRQDVLRDRSIVVLSRAGAVDQVIRVAGLPVAEREDGTRLQYAKKGSPMNETEPGALVLNLDRGPDQEKWADIERQIFVRARRDQSIPKPRDVSPSPRDEWELGPEDVPTVTLLAEVAAAAYVAPAAPQAPQEAKGAIEATAATQEAPSDPTKPFACKADGCGRAFPNAGGLRLHAMKKHEEKA